MNKKLFLGMFAAAGMLLATSCSNDELDVVQSGNEAQVTFSLGLEGGIATRAISDGKSADKLIYAVFDKDGNRISTIDAVTKKNVTFPTTENITLAKGQTYKVAFWAQDTDCEAYTVDTDKMSVAVNYANDKNKTNNDETRDAFFKTVEFTVTGSTSIDVEMKRPFAQINVGVTEKDWEAAVASGIEIEKSSVVIKNAATSLNLLTGAVGEATTDVTVEYTSKDIPDEKLKVATGENGKEEEYYWLSMSYILVADHDETEDDNGLLGTDKATLDGLQYTFTPKEGEEIKFEEGLAGAPVRRNWRTNILGKILTGNIEFNITIDPAYQDDYIYPNKMEEELVFAATFGGTVTLTSNVTLTQPLVVTKDMVINLGEYTIKGGKEYAEGLTGADISAVVVDNGASLTIEGGEKGTIEGAVYGVYAKEGTVTIKSGNIKAGTSAVQVYNATANIEGGYFSNTIEDKTFVINCIDANYKNGTAKVNITGGTFEGFNPANNDAEGANTNFVAQGYSAIELETDKWTVTEGNNAQAVSSATDIAKALNDPTTDKIVLTDNVELESGLKFGVAASTYSVRSASTTLEGRDIVIDGNGKTLTYKGTAGTDARIINVTDAAAGMNLTLKNITLVNEAGNYIERAINYNTNGTLTLENVTIGGGENSNPITYAVNLAAGSDNAIVNISNSTITCAFALNVWGENLKIDVTDSHLNSVGSTSNDGYAAIALNYDAGSGNMANGTVVNVTGGTISATSTEEGFKPLAIRNAAVNSEVNVSATTKVTGEIVNLHYVAKVTYPPYTDQFYGYETLQGAIDKAAENENAVLCLMENIEVTSQLNITGKVVLDLSGYTIEGNFTEVNQAVIYVNSENADLTIQGEGTVTTTGGYPVRVKNGKVTINGGNYTATNSTQAVYVDLGTATINGGYFNVDSKYNGTNYLDANGNAKYLLNCNDTAYKANPKNANIIVTGGTFYNFNPGNNVAEGNNTNFVANDCTSTKNETDNTWTVTANAAE